MRLLLTSVVLVLAQLGAGSAIPRRAEAPTVDLDYAVHQAVLNKPGDYYSFKNIRFAEAPIGDLRWRKPVPPQTRNRTVVNGSDVTDPVCPQAYPGWVLAGRPELEQFNATAEELSDLLLMLTPMTEDCLFLDVHVPTEVFEEKGKHDNDGPSCGNKGAPVMVWIYGGGYTGGSKASDGYNPAGLIAASRSTEPIIYIALNYRLGMFGWLNAGSDNDVLANAGLHDQRLALEWIKKNVKRFGGDPHRVTVFGESAGGGSIMHHLTAYGGEGKKSRAPFRRAIIQSPGWTTTPDTNDSWERVLAQATEVAGSEITDADGLRSLTSDQLLKINSKVIFAGDHGSFSFGPSVDGDYVPDLPGALLQQGKFDHCVQIMAGHNTNESATFVPPTTGPEETAENFEAASYGVSPATQYFILTTLYPPVYDGSYPYTSEFARETLLTSEMSFTCNTRYLGTAYAKTYNYRFQIPPGLHGQDIPYTFFSGPSSDDDEEDDSDVIPQVATAMQSYFVEFARDGTPDVEGQPTWPLYQSGDGHTIITFDVDGVAVAEDALKNVRCQYWQNGEYRDAL